MSSQGWYPGDEKIFIDGLGQHGEYKDETPYEIWLMRYIAAHESSRHYHHREGIAYARKKLRNIFRLKEGHKHD